MQKLILNHNEILQGEFEVKSLNFLFVFQVNCPGCFIYGIPMVNKLYKESGNQIPFLGLSTAFEDYEYNNTENTKLLLFKNEVVGETKKSLLDQGFEKNPTPIEFPVAMDALAKADFDYNIGAEKICQINPDYKIWPKFEQDSLRKRVISYLKNQEKLSITFTLNQFRGTPTMVVFNDQYEILFHKFGHTNFDNIKPIIGNLIDQFK